MKERDRVKFNSQAPLYLIEKLGNGEHKIGFVDGAGWIFLKNDPGDPKKMIHQVWLHIVKKA